MYEDESSLILTDDWILLPFGLQIDPRESVLPIMPETIDADSSISGKDGEINLNTVYGARNFEIVGYSPEGLTMAQKIDLQDKISYFLHKFKNNTFRLCLKPSNRSYNVKYHGSLDIEPYPQSFKISVPLKCYEAFGYANLPTTIVGNGSKKSNTVNPTGFICTIKGPISNPLNIKFNESEIIFENTILESETLIINTKNSTITKIDKNGEENNMLKYYKNKVFPKVVEGLNEVQVKSGVNKDNVTIEWYDLKF